MTPTAFRKTKKMQCDCCHLPSCYLCFALLVLLSIVLGPILGQFIVLVACLAAQDNPSNRVRGDIMVEKEQVEKKAEGSDAADAEKTAAAAAAEPGTPEKKKRRSDPPVVWRRRLGLTICLECGNVLSPCTCASGPQF